MSWNFSNDVPIYLQIMEHFKVQRTSGRFVADRGKQIDRLKQDMALELCESFHNGMKKIGFTPEEAIAEYKEYISRIEE